MANKKIHIPASINAKLKKEFDALENIHKQTYDNALEAGMEAAIFLAQSPATIKRLINKTDMELHNLRRQLEIVTEQDKDKSDFRWG